MLSIVSLISLYEFYFLIKKISKNNILAVTISTFGAFYLFFFVNSALNIHEAKGEFFVLFILLIIIFSDIGGYIVGKIVA